MRKGLLQALAPLAAGVLLLAALIAAGRWARGRLRGQDSWSLPFAAIECEPPAGLPREDFLGEVQYLADQPDRLPLLDEALPARLARAFAAHPWVEDVQRVEVLPGRRLRVDLTYRRAVLAVCLPSADAAADGSVLLESASGAGPDALVPCRAVDRHGVLLPVKATQPGLPLLHADVAAPAGRPGTAWGDGRVHAAAAAAAFLEPYREPLGLGDAWWEAAGDTLVLRRARLRLVWGRAPGQEAPGEALAADKVRRLLDYLAEHHTLDGPAHDLRR
jgi:hypothetical protein